MGSWEKSGIHNTKLPDIIINIVAHFMFYNACQKKETSLVYGAVLAGFLMVFLSNKTADSLFLWN